MDFIITIIRFPFGIIATIVVVGFWLFAFPFELFLAIFLLPLGAIFMTREEFKNSWIGGFPNSIRQIRYSVSNIWEWVGSW